MEILKGMTNYEKYNLIIAAVAAFSTTVAIIWVLFKETLFALWKKPSFQGRFFMDMPYITRLVERGLPTYYYHLGVKNIGRSTALNCRGYVDGIYEYNNGQFERINLIHLLVRNKRNFWTWVLLKQEFIIQEAYILLN